MIPFGLLIASMPYSYYFLPDVLLFEPGNPEAQNFAPLIEEKLRIEAEDSDSEDESDSDDSDDDDDDDDDDDTDDDEEEQFLRIKARRQSQRKKKKSAAESTDGEYEAADEADDRTQLRSTPKPPPATGSP